MKTLLELLLLPSLALADSPQYIKGGTDDTFIGNIGDEAKSACFLQAGSATIGKVDQGAAGATPWLANVTQFGSTNVVTGTGVSGSGIPRVTVSSDSSITANAGTNLNTSALALDATIAKLNITPGASSTGQTGPMSQGLVNTSSPSYSDSTIRPLSLDGSGNLRTVGSANGSPVAATVRQTQPTAFSDGSSQIPGISGYGLNHSQSEPSTLAIWGKMFSGSTNFVSTGTTGQSPMALFRNPNGSGVNCKLRLMDFDASGGTIRIYQDPTVTTNGTTVTTSGNRQTGQATAQCVLSTLPTVSANGTLFKAKLINTQNIYHYGPEFSRWVEPNHAILVTIAQSSNSTAGSLDIEWGEQP